MLNVGGQGGLYQHDIYITSFVKHHANENTQCHLTSYLSSQCIDVLRRAEGGRINVRCCCYGGMGKILCLE